MPKSPEDETARRLLESVFENPIKGVKLAQFVKKELGDFDDQELVVLVKDEKRGYTQTLEYDGDLPQIIERFSSDFSNIEAERFLYFDQEDNLTGAAVWFNYYQGYYDFCFTPTEEGGINVQVVDAPTGEFCLGLDYDSNGDLLKIKTENFTISERRLFWEVIEEEGYSNLSREEIDLLSAEKKIEILEKYEEKVRWITSPSLGLKFLPGKEISVVKYPHSNVWFHEDEGEIGVVPFKQEFDFSGLVFKVWREKGKTCLEIKNPEDSRKKTASVLSKIDVNDVRMGMLKEGTSWLYIYDVIPIELEMPIEGDKIA